MRIWLQEIRGEKTQSEIASILGIAQGYYSDIENGRKTPRPSTAKKIATVLGFDWKQFYEAIREEDSATFKKGGADIEEF